METRRAILLESAVNDSATFAFDFAVRIHLFRLSDACEIGSKRSWWRCRVYRDCKVVTSEGRQVEGLLGYPHLGS
jgi:hypothetical protein